MYRQTSKVSRIEELDNCLNLMEVTLSVAKTVTENDQVNLLQ